MNVNNVGINCIFQVTLNVKVATNPAKNARDLQNTIV